MTHVHTYTAAFYIRITNVSKKGPFKRKMYSRCICSLFRIYSSVRRSILFKGCPKLILYKGCPELFLYKGRPNHPWRKIDTQPTHLTKPLFQEEVGFIQYVHTAGVCFKLRFWHIFSRHFLDVHINVK